MAIAGKSGQLILNSRASGAKFSPYRPTYFSKDNGVSWGSAKNSKWKDSINKNKHGCEGSLLGIGKAVFYFNPTGQGKKARTKMEVRCSLDGGRTLSGEAYAVTSTSKGGYSQMAPTGSTKKPLLIGWGDTTNVFVERIDTDWCH